MTNIDWKSEEVCCGFIWYQFRHFSNHVKYCPMCGSKIYEIPAEALE